MLKRLLIIGAVVGLVVAAAVPASAAKAVKTSYIIAECGGTLVSPPERVWVTGQDGMHLRGAANRYVEWVLEGEDWREIGTNTTRANLNVKLPDFEGPFWGTFSFRDDDTLGDIDGTWVWPMTATGKARGKTMHGESVKITLGIDPTGFPAPPGEGCLLTEFLVISTNG